MVGYLFYETKRICFRRSKLFTQTGFSLLCSNLGLCKFPISIPDKRDAGDRTHDASKLLIQICNDFMEKKIFIRPIQGRPYLSHLNPQVAPGAINVRSFQDQK